MLKTRYRNLYEGHDFVWGKQLNHIDHGCAFDKGDLKKIHDAVFMQEYVPERIIKHLIDGYGYEDDKPSKHAAHEWLHTRYRRCKLENPKWGPTKAFIQYIEPLIEKEGLHDAGYTVDKLRYAIKIYGK